MRLSEDLDLAGRHRPTVRRAALRPGSVGEGGAGVLAEMLGEPAGMRETPSAGASPIQAYAAAKLGNLLTAQHLAAQPELLARDVSVVAYNPGLTGGTGLQRALPEVRAQVEAMRKRSEQQGGGGAHHHVGTPERAGQALAELALGTVPVPDGVVYASLERDEITFPDPSELARRGGSALELWRETQDLLAG